MPRVRALTDPDTICTSAYSPSAGTLSSWWWEKSTERERISGEPAIENFKKWHEEMTGK
jgi:hypothetical protein